MDIFKDLYESELTRRQQLSAAVALPAGVLSLLGGMLTHMVREYSWSGGVTQRVFIVASLLAGLSFVAAVVFLIRSYWGVDAQYVARADELLSYMEKLEQHFAEHCADGQAAEEHARTQFERSLEKRMAEAAAYNAQQNDRRSELLYRANGALILTLFLGAISAIPYSQDVVANRKGMNCEQGPKATAAAATTNSPSESVRPVVASPDPEGSATTTEEE